jgi:hypothetical protein
MSRFLAMLMTLIAFSSAGATSRYSALQLTCGEIKSIIRNEGAAIFRYPSPRKKGLTLYDRYVRNDTYCASHQSTEKVYIPSANADQCLVQRCVTRPDNCLGATCF